MLGSSKPVPFDPYRGRRSRSGVPRWLVLLLAGTAVGGAGVVYVQERYLPPRLSAKETETLRTSFETADAARLRLQGELTTITQQLQTALADKKKLADERAASTATTERLRTELATLIAALPPDPRGGSVQVRAAQFVATGGGVAYDVVLTRARGAGGAAMNGVVQFVVAGVSSRGVDTALSPQQVSVAMGPHEVVRGNLAMPEGFKPREATIQVLDRSGGRSLGMRVLPVK
jgi:hypothetical protein